MISDKDKIEIICRERDNLRLEIIEIAKHINKVVFAFLTVAVFVLGIYWDSRLLPNESLKSKVLFALSQIEFFLSVFAIALWANQRFQSGYIASLENKINSLCGETISFWESKMSMGYGFHPRSLFFWTTLIFIIMSLMLFIFLISMAFNQISSIWFGSMLTFEILVLIALMIGTYTEQRRVLKYANKIFKIMED